MASLLFDLDGTLIDSKECILSSIRYSLAKLDLSELTFDEIRVTQQELQKTFAEMMAEADLPWDGELLRRFIDHYRWFHEHEAEGYIQTYAGVAEVLDSLRSDFRMGVATTKHSEQAVRVVRRVGLDSFFDHIQGTDPGMRYKPEPDILLHVLSRIGKTAERSAYVGDSIHDMDAARAGGLRRIGAAYGFAGEKPLRTRDPDWMIYHFSDLASLQPELRARLSWSF